MHVLQLLTQEQPIQANQAKAKDFSTEGKMQIHMNSHFNRIMTEKNKTALQLNPK